MPKITRTLREKYTLQQWQLMHLLFWVHPAAERITVKVGKNGYHAKGFDRAENTLFEYSRGDAQKHIDNPFLLFLDHITRAQMLDPKFNGGNIAAMFYASELYRKIIDCDVDPDIGLYAHTLNLLMQRAVAELYNQCLAVRGESPRPTVVLLREASIA